MGGDCDTAPMHCYRLKVKLLSLFFCGGEGLEEENVLSTKHKVAEIFLHYYFRIIAAPSQNFPIYN